jgi:hypothetical protein
MRNRVLLISAVGLVIMVGTGGYLARATGASDDDASEQQRAQDLKLLEGLPGVLVVVEDVEKPLDKYHIRTVVELRLRRAGVPVLGPDAWFETKSWPYLYVNVNRRKVFEDPVYAVGIHISLKEQVIPVRKASMPIDATTWEMGSVAILGSSKLLDGVDKFVSDHVDRFANLYLAANSPKKGTTQPSR